MDTVKIEKAIDALPMEILLQDCYLSAGFFNSILKYVMDGLPFDLELQKNGMICPVWYVWGAGFRQPDRDTIRFISYTAKLKQ